MRLRQTLPGVGVDVLAGVRYVNLSERLSLDTRVDASHNITTVFEPALGLPTGAIPVLNNTETNLATSDTFSTRNDFVGPQFGGRGEQHWGQLWASADGRLALGVMVEHVSISGS